MKDSTGWYLCWSSSYLDIPVERIAINAKVMSANQDNTNKMVAASAGSLVRLWSIADAGESREIGNGCHIYRWAADQGVTNSIMARSHTFVEIDHEIISTVILLPSAESFKKGCCQLQTKVY